MTITNTLKAILIVPIIAVLLSAVVPHTQRAFAQVDCNATPDDPSCQSSPPNDNSQQNSPPSVDCNANPNDPSCLAPSPPQPSTQTCPDGSVIDVSATCPATTPTSPPAVDCNTTPNDPSCQTTTGNNNQPTVSCDPTDNNPSPGCNQPAQPDSAGSCPSGTGITHYGSCCPHGTMNVHAYCETQAQHDKNMAQAAGTICDFIGVAGSLITGHWFQTATGWICR